MLKSVVEAINLLGVNPEKEHLYKKNELVCPGNPTKKLTPEMINDDFCDCPEDGFDEPGTSACNSGLFYCANKKFFSKEISSTFVNDGVCGTQLFDNIHRIDILVHRLLRWL